MIYVIDYNDEIIETLDTNEDYILSADMSWNINTLESTFTFQILNEHSTNLQKRVRVLARDNKGKLREFIVLQAEQLLNGVTEVNCVASYLEDLLTAKPLKPTTLSQQTTSQSLSYFLADTGIKVSESNEYGGVKTVSWTGWSDRLSNAKMLQTTYDMRLDFYIEVDKNKVSGRYGRLISKKYLNVSTLEDDNPNFKGGEIVYGENMINLKRSIDHTEVRTALIALGPENSETGERIIIDYKDDDAQSQFGLPGRYLYDLYEPESSDENMTESRLRTLAKTHLNKLNKSAISYEVDSLSLYADVGDMIRVKNEDFTPELYVDAEIIAIDYDLISEVEKYQFGVINEYDRSQVMKNVQKILDEVRERIKNSDANIDQIIRDYEELENVYEPKIVKGPTPPESPRLGDLWLDTSDPNVAILKRYENGKWVKSSVSNVEEIGGITREEAIYLDLKDKNLLNTENYSDFTRQMNELKNSKYYHYISNEYNPILNNAYNQLYNAYNDFINSYQSINAESPTINKLTDALSKDIKFIEAYNRAKKVLDQARTAYNDYLVILQNQYSDEKYNEAMEKVATELGGHFDGTNIIADVPLKKDLDDLNTAIKQYLNGEIETLDTELGKKIENILINTKEEIRLGIESVEKKVDGIEIGGRNLVLNSDDLNERSKSTGITTSKVDDGIYKNVLKVNNPNLASYITISSDNYASYPTPNKDFTVSFLVKGKVGINKDPNITLYYNAESRYQPYAQEVSETEYRWISLTYNLKNTVPSNHIGVSNFSELYIARMKVELGNKPTDWTPAPEDIENKVTTIDQSVTKNSSSISVLEKDIKLKVDNTTVDQKLTDALKPIKTSVDKNTAELVVQANEISQKVSSTKYTTDQTNTIKRFEKNEGNITTLQNEIKLKVTETDVQNKIDEMEIGGRNLVKDSKNIKIIGADGNSGIIEFNNSENLIRIDAIGNKTTTQNFYSTSFMNSWVNKNEIFSNIQRGVPYTLSMEVKYNGASNVQMGFDTRGVNSADYARTEKISDTGGKWVKLSATKVEVGRSVNTQSLLIGWFDSVKVGDYLEIRNLKLEKGNKATDWTPAPEDTDERIKNAESEIKVNAGAISQKVSYTEINKTNKTLERVISELIVDVRGISYQYDVNGMISGFTLNKDYFKLNHNLIDINNGDVVIKNGTTTIKQAVIHNGHISELSFDKLKGGTATFGGPEQNGTFEVLDVNGNAIMKADYEQANLSEISIGTANIENLYSPSVVPMAKNPRKYTVNKTKYGHLEEAQAVSEVGPNLIKGGRQLTYSGGSNTSYTYNYVNITEPLVKDEIYTISFDVQVTSGSNSGKIDIRPYQADGGAITVDIVNGRVEHTFTSPTDSKELLMYRDVMAKANSNITLKIENLKLEKGETATIWVEAGSIEEDETSSNSSEETWIAGSIQQAIDSIPTYIQDYIYIYIDTITDDDEVMIEGFVGRGWIRIWYNIPKNYNSFTISTHVRVDVLGGYANGYNTGLFPNKTGGVITYNKNPYSLVRAMHLHGDGGAEYGMSVIQGSTIVIRDSKFYNVKHGIYLSENAKVTAINVAGMADEYGWYVNWGSSIWGSGTVRPMGKLGASRRLNGSRDMTDFTVEKPPVVTNPPKVPPTTIPKTVTKRWSTTSARTFYRNQPNAYTVRFMRDYAVQGNLGDGFGFRDGAWYFGTGMRNTLKGKKIKKVRVSIGRSSANSQGFVGSRKFTLRLHKSSNKPASSNNTNPSFSSNNFTASLAMGERKWYDVTSAFASALATGTWYGFGVKTDSSSKYEYMAMAKSITVEVTYE